MRQADDDRAVAAVAAAVVHADAYRAADAAAAALVDALGVRWAVIYQTDYVMRQLHPIGGTPVRTDHRSVNIDSSAAGQVFRSQQPTTTTATADQEVLTLPLTSRGHRIGVVQLGCRSGEASVVRGRAVGCVELLAPLLWEATRGDDVMERRRRATRLSLPAEMQWQLLQGRGLEAPDEFSVYAQLEPAELVSSDLFDWSYDGRKITVMLLDALGEGITAAQNSELALTALRNARRASLPAVEAVSLADQALWDQFRGGAEVAAMVIEHDLHTGTTTIINAGAPPPLIWRDHIQPVHVLSDAPLGVADQTPYRSQTIDFRPGDLMMLVTDGVLGAQNAAGEAFGVQGLIRELESGVPDMEIPRQIVHRVRDHVDTLLPDDATCIALRLH